MKELIPEKDEKEVKKEEKISLPTEYGGDHSVRQIYEGRYQLARGHAGSAFYGGGIKPSVADSPLRARSVAKSAPIKKPAAPVAKPSRPAVYVPLRKPAAPVAKPSRPAVSVPLRKPAAPVAKPAAPALSGGGTSGPPHKPPSTSSAPPLPQRKPTLSGGLPSPTTAKSVGPSPTVGAGPAGIHINPSPSRGPGSALRDVPGSTLPPYVSPERLSAAKDRIQTLITPNVGGSETPASKAIGDKLGLPPIADKAPSDNITVTSRHTGKEVTFPTKLGSSLSDAWKKSVGPERGGTYTGSSGGVSSGTGTAASVLNKGPVSGSIGPGSTLRDVPGNVIPSRNISTAPIQSQIPTGNMNLMPGATPPQSSMSKLKAITKRGLPERYEGDHSVRKIYEDADKSN